MQATGFFAYPVVSTIVTDAILGAVELSKSEGVQLKPWQKLTIVGFKIDDLIREQIHDVQFLVADITYPNYNVLYEIGYAIAVGKPVIATVNVAIEKAVKRIQQIGLFDTIGWATYSNAGELHEKLRLWEDISWTGKYLRRKDHSQPLFILDLLKKTDFRNYIFHAVENSHVKHRSFDQQLVMFFSRWILKKKKIFFFVQLRYYYPATCALRQRHALPGRGGAGALLRRGGSGRSRSISTGGVARARWAERTAA